MKRKREEGLKKGRKTKPVEMDRGCFRERYRRRRIFMNFSVSYYFVTSGDRVGEKD